MKLREWVRVWFVLGLLSPVFGADAATATLLLTTNGSGTVSANPTNAVVPLGAVVVATATAAPGWVFSSWSGSITSTSNPVNISMDSDKTVVANFVSGQHFSLNVVVTGNGAVAPFSSLYISNTLVQITATPSNGWVFHHWTGDATGNANPLGVTMNANKSIGAVFGALPAFLSQPASVNASAGDLVSFSANASSPTPVAYQWRWNGSSLTGATGATLTLTNVRTAQAGGYQVVVTNLYGGLTSAVATLVVQCQGTNIVAVCTDSALRQAVAAGGVVRFCCDGTIALTNTIRVTRDVVLDGTLQNVSISGQGARRIFEVTNGVSFIASNIVFTDGAFFGASSSSYSGTGANGEGAAIRAVDAVVQLFGCVVKNNAVTGGNGGPCCLGPSSGAGGMGLGGAIYASNTTLTLDGTVFLNNQAKPGALGPSGPTTLYLPVNGRGYGGAVYVQGGTVGITNCDFSTNSVLAMNSADESGGGALFLSNVVGQIHGTKFRQNKGEPISSPATTNLLGGALYVASGSVTVSGGFFVANRTLGALGTGSTGGGNAAGGAICNRGTLTVQNCTISSNLAITAGNQSHLGGGFGGGIWNAGTLSVGQSTLLANRADGGDDTWVFAYGGDAAGGALLNIGQSFLTNCTVALNQARARGPLAYNFQAFGGGISSTGGTVTLVNVTVASNTTTMASPPASSGANLHAANGSVALLNTILAGADNVLGPVVDNGFNICSDGTASLNSGASFSFTNPKLLPLASNNGSTMTMSLAPDSPAIDFATTSGAPFIDQRGLVRPLGAGVDIGAVETGVPGAPVITSARVSGTIRLSFTTQPGPAYELQHSSNFLDWQTVETISGSGSCVRSFNSTNAVDFYRLRFVW
jgi:hypothetical protein